MTSGGTPLGHLRLVGNGDPANPGYQSGRDLDWSILMGHAQQGDRIAYLRLLKEITPYLRKRMARFHADQRDIEDTVQDILMTVHAIRQTYDPTRPFGPWLSGIANRRAFDRLKRQYRVRAHESVFTTEHEDVAADTDNSLTANDRNRLEAAIAELPYRQQQALRMTKLNEMSLAEASAASGLSIATLKVATHRAIKTLRAMLVQEGER
ncbi:sigma-70 family RNA polymerase sigma factor [soil metagenome]